MKIAPNKYALKRRLDRYLWRNGTTEMAYLKRILNTHFKEFKQVAIVGGLVRDFAREGRSGFRSDVDLVIDSPEEQVAQLAEKLGAISNRFGGYGCKIGPWEIDFWALETTWARKHVPVSKLDDILDCTFFDWDAIAYNLWERKLICHDDYLDKLKNNLLNINLLQNPSPEGNLVRAIRRLMIWQVEPGPELRNFIDENLNERALRYVQEKEKELFSNQISTSWLTVTEAKQSIFLDVFERKCRQFHLFYQSVSITKNFSAEYRSDNVMRYIRERKHSSNNARISGAIGSTKKKMEFIKKVEISYEQFDFFINRVIHPEIN